MSSNIFKYIDFVVSQTIVVLCFCYNVSFSQNTPKWQWLNPRPQGNALWSINFNNEKEGWICGFCGTIMHTTDGGITWDIKYGKNEERYDIFRKMFFPDRLTGFIVGGNLHGNAKILKTTNSGLTWEEKTTPEHCNTLWNVFFFDSNNGFVVGSGIHKTTDGGETWNSDYSLRQNIYSIYFLNSNEGWLGGREGTIYHTSDGGQTWETQRNEYQVRQIRSIYFLDASNGWAVGDKGLVVRTTDGGKNWNNYWVIREDEDYHSISFDALNNGWLLGEKYIYISSNNGNTWNEVNAPDTTAEWKDFSVVSNRIIYAVGLHGDIRKTTDNGLTWISLSHGTGYDNFINNLKFFDKYNGIRNTSGKKIQKTSDGGETWETTATMENLRYIYFYNEDLFWGIESYAFKSTISRSIDGGQSWITQKDNIAVILFEAFFLNDKKGYICGTERVSEGLNKGLLMKTTDGGDTWHRQDIADIPGWFFSIAFGSDLTGCIGASEMIFYTTDGGETWHKSSKTFAEFIDVMDIHLINGKEGWGAGDEGLIIHTTDGGISWTTQESGTDEYLEHIFFTDELNGWACGDGTVLHTTDGGSNWVLTDYPSSESIRGVCFTDKNNGWFWGSNNALIKYTSGTTDIKNSQTIPETNRLLYNYPNPFNTETVITYQLSTPGYVELQIFNTLGQEVKTLVNEYKPYGTHRLIWDGTDNRSIGVSSGIYFCILKTKDFIETKKMILMR